jgi:hypothetical protein
MTAGVEELAHQIASLDEANLQSALCAVGITQSAQEVHALSDRYRKRLSERREINQAVEEILRKLHPLIIQDERSYSTPTSGTLAPFRLSCLR